MQRSPTHRSVRYAVLAWLAACSSPTIVASVVPPVLPAPSVTRGSRVEPAATCSTTAVRGDRERDPRPFLWAGVAVGFRERPERGASCQAARSTLDDESDAVLAAGSRPRSAVASRPWDHRSTPVGWQRVADRFGLGAEHRARLDANGFTVASDAHFWSYVEAYHEVFQSQLPIYVSLDSIMHAIYASHGRVVSELERTVIQPRIAHALDQLGCWLAEHPRRWSPGIARDVDLYLAVARSLLADAPVRTVFGRDAEVARWVADITAAKGLRSVELFGRSRELDFSQFEPRAYYQGAMDGYFRAFTWLSRIELNLVSRSSRSSTTAVDRRETPHEVAIALALADAAEQAGVMADLIAVDRVMAALAGTRQDVSLDQLAALRRDAGITTIDETVQARLALAIGDRFHRTIPTQPHPDGETDLPVIAAVIGPRVTADVEAIAPIIQPAVPGRVAIGANDMAYLLGHDRALVYLAEQRTRFPGLEAGLAQGRRLLAARDGGDDLYATWLAAIRAIALVPAGALPSYERTDAFADLRLSSAIGAFGQLRHDHVLIAGQAYLGSGCEIPDGYVEPAVAVYDALIRYAERGAAAVRELDPDDRARTAAYWPRLASTLRVLRTIATDELAGRALTTAQRRWLSMVVEIVLHDASGAPPSYAGWYFDLFVNFDAATLGPDFVADYASNADVAMYIGASEPRMGVFVVDTGGRPRVVTGPIGHSFEFTRPLASGRSTDAEPPLTGDEPWSASYTLTPPGPQPAWDWELASTSPYLSFEVTSRTDVGPVTVEVLDHHRERLDRIVVNVLAGTTVVTTHHAVGHGELLHLVAGGHSESQPIFSGK